MKSIRRGLWDGEVEKDARGRFTCRVCRQSLVAQTAGVERGGDATDGGNASGTVRTCPDCGRAWET